MKQYPIFGVLASGLAVLAFSNAAQAQNSLPEDSPVSREQSRAAIECFAQVKERVLAGNPQLKSQTATLRSLHALTQQAALIPNPVVTFEAENFGGNRLEDDVEYTGGLSQLIETGGKRHARTSLARANAQAYELRRDISTAEILAKARVTYAEVVAAKSRLALSEKEVAIRREAKRLISRKSSHGGALRLEVEKAEVSLQTAELVRDQRKQELTVAKRTLASLWGSHQADLTFTARELQLHDPETELLVMDAGESPDVAFAAAKREAAEKSVDLQRAMAIPDVTVSAGYRRFDATDDHAFVADVSIPLPLFDRNQFATDGAEERLKASQFDASRTRVTVNAQLDTLRDRLRLLLRERKLLEGSLLPQTEKVLTSATDAYSLGRIAYLDYLDAQTTYLERRERLVTVKLSAIRNQVEIQQLTGTFLERTTQMHQGECHAQ
ncbi:MAG: TolC family protein [Planctomycetota bacterium]